MYKLHRVLLFSIVLIGICGGNGDASGSSSHLGAIELEDTRIKETIYAYFSSRCDVYKSNSPTINFSSIVDTQNSPTTEWLELEQEIREIQNLIQTTYPVNILDCRFRLDFQTIEIIDNTVAIAKLSEDNEVIYEHRPTKPSVVANIQHEIWLKRTIDRWVIVEDKYSNDFTRLLKTLSMDSIIENIRKNRDINHEDVSLMDQKITVPTTTNTENGMQLYNYDGTAAVAYADIYYDRDATDGPVPSVITGLDG